MPHVDAFDLSYALDLDAEDAMELLSAAFRRAGFELPWQVVEVFGEPSNEAELPQLDLSVSADPWERPYTASGGSAMTGLNGATPDQARERLAALAAATRYLAASGHVRKLSLNRVGPSVYCLPYHRIRRKDGGIRTIHANDIALTLCDPDRFRVPEGMERIGWERLGRAVHGVIWARGLDRPDEESWREQAVPMQWALARLSRPGLTEHPLGEDLPPDERAWSQVGPRTLSERDGVLSADPRHPISGWELYELALRVQGGEELVVELPSPARLRDEEVVLTDLRIPFRGRGSS